MQLKTQVHVNIDLYFGSDDATNESEIGRLAAILDELRLLMRVQRPANPPEAQVAQLSEPHVQIEPLPTPLSLEADTSESDAPAGATRSWSFEAFDRAVRAEMARIAVDGVMPSTGRWDRGRKEPLPSLAGVMKRYGCPNLPALADKLGLTFEPKPGRPGNGHEPRRRL